MQISNEIAKKVLLVEPTNFCSNHETKGDNFFMQDIKEIDAQKNASLEFSHYTELLDKNNVEFEVFKQTNLNAPDSIFPNNWFLTLKNEFFPGRFKFNFKMVCLLFSQLKHLIEG